VPRALTDDADSAFGNRSKPQIHKQWPRAAKSGQGKIRSHVVLVLASSPEQFSHGFYSNLQNYVSGIGTQR